MGRANFFIFGKTSEEALKQPLVPMFMRIESLSDADAAL
jgi:hypothetical protein